MSLVAVAGTNGGTVILNTDKDMNLRVAWVVREMKARGRSLFLTEGYRPKGVPADRNVRIESQTSTGGSNQYYQHGRMLRGETPSAINPDYADSRHFYGLAIDWNAPSDIDMAHRALLMSDVGLVANVSSESWHAEPLRAVKPNVSLTPLKDGFLMALADGAQLHLAAEVSAIRASQVHPEGYTYDAAILRVVEQLRNESKEILGIVKDLKTRVETLEKAK